MQFTKRYFRQETGILWQVVGGPFNAALSRSACRQKVVQSVSISVTIELGRSYKSPVGRSGRRKGLLGLRRDRRVGSDFCLGIAIDTFAFDTSLELLDEFVGAEGGGACRQGKYSAIRL